MNRYQLKPAGPSTSNLNNGPTRAESKLDNLAMQKSFKDLDVHSLEEENSQDSPDDHSEAKFSGSIKRLSQSQRQLSAKDEPASVATNYDEEYEDHSFEELDDDDKAVPLQHDRDLFDTHDSTYDDAPKNVNNQSSNRLRTDSNDTISLDSKPNFHDSNFSTFAPNAPFSALSTGDISHQMELESDSELWSSIWTEKRGYVGEKNHNSQVVGGRRTLTGSQPLNTLAEEQEVPTPHNADHNNNEDSGMEIEVRLNFYTAVAVFVLNQFVTISKQLLEYIDVAKSKALNALGESLFW